MRKTSLSKAAYKENNFNKFQHRGCHDDRCFAKQRNEVCAQKRKMRESGVSGKGVGFSAFNPSVDLLHNLRSLIRLEMCKTSPAGRQSTD